VSDLDNALESVGAGTVKQPNSYGCFICGMENRAGVQGAFYEVINEGVPEVLARFSGRPAHQGYPGRLHGGVVAGILDEVMERALHIGLGAALPPVWGVTVELAVRYLLPVPLAVELTARGRVTRDSRRLFEASAELYLPDGAVAVRATAKYMKMSLDAIAAAESNDLGWQIYPDR
jgi:acyl-coenzyme A thioesterase PaaI-like protein